MTATNPEQRKQVYEILQVSSVEIYHLTKTLSKGNVINKETTTTTSNFKHDQQIACKRETLFRKDSGYSFGATVQQHNHIQTQTVKILPVDNSKRIVLNHLT